MVKKYDLIVIPGRFEPFHLGHIANVQEAMKLADNIMFLVGSINQPRNIKNPFSYHERYVMIHRIFNTPEFSFGGVEDNLYSDTMWAKSVREEVENNLRMNPTLCNIKEPKIALMGHAKDESSYYLSIFPTWKVELTEGFKKQGNRVIDATKIRELMFEGNFGFIESVVHPTTFQMLLDFKETEDYQNLVNEYNFIKKYKAAWTSAPYPVTFNTVDAAVIQSDNILLVQRKSAPGKDLWALPGGFLNQNETTAQAVVRELIEETKIKVPKRTLEQIVGNCYQKCFDHPGRSLRGRTITQAFLIELSDPNGLPVVKGSDDAKDAKWFSFSELEKMKNVMFEDHWDMAIHFVSRT